MHLLVIEDERALCETIVRSLRRAAYSVDYCCDVGHHSLEEEMMRRAAIHLQHACPMLEVVFVPSASPFQPVHPRVL